MAGQMEDNDMKNNLVLTDVGIKPIGDLVNRKMRVIVGHKSYPTDGFRIDGTEEMFQINTIEGYSVVVPSSCSLSVSFDGIIFKQKLKNITIGDKVLLAPPSSHCWDSLNDDNLDGYLLGLLIGDGTISHKNDLVFGILYFQETDNSILGYLNSQIHNMPICRDDDGRYICYFDRVHQLVRDFGLVKTKEIVDILKYGGHEFLCGFLSGFFDADGTVNKKALNILFTQTNYRRIQLVQILLLLLGIRSAVYPCFARKSNCKKHLVSSKKSYIIYIGNDDAVRFHNLIGFHHEGKRQILVDRIRKMRRGTICKCGAIVSSVESIGTQTKYVVDAPDYVSNGIIIH